MEGQGKCKYTSLTGNGMTKVLKVCVHQCTVIHAGVHYRCSHQSWEVVLPHSTTEATVKLWKVRLKYMN